MATVTLMSKSRKHSLEWDDTDDISESIERKRIKSQTRQREERQHGFDCSHCRDWVPINETIGTHNRNHCPHCLWSKHVDGDRPGDRKSNCKEGMRPIAVTFKGESLDKYATSEAQVLGELMLVHDCVRGDMLRVNRIAADDNHTKIFEVFEQSQSLPEYKRVELVENRIHIATEALSAFVAQQLFGNEQFDM